VRCLRLILFSLRSPNENYPTREPYHLSLWHLDRQFQILLETTTSRIKVRMRHLMNDFIKDYEYFGILLDLSVLYKFTVKIVLLIKLIRALK
jgi:hypothetical protein